MEKNVEFLGQVFTPKHIVEDMLRLKQNTGRTLEPSCGDGAFFSKLLNSNVVAIEYDKKVCPSQALNIDFFDYSLEEKFDTIIGNPPYVKYQNISLETRSKLNMTIFDERSNLYLFFIEKCVKHLKEKGELIFIVPRDFIKATSAIKLNEFLYSQGTITHWKDLGDTIIFPGFSPNCVIFRFEKGNFSRKTLVEDRTFNFNVMNGQIVFTSKNYSIEFSKLFYVKVGAVSGYDQAFIHPHGNCDFVYSKTKDTGQTRKMFYNMCAKELEPYKEQLLKRKIKPFNHKNWYTWGRNYFDSTEDRIYVNGKTRRKAPFFLHKSTCFDGSILAIFPRIKLTPEQLLKVTHELNGIDWNELGFICNGRYIFTQRALENVFLPDSFKTYLPCE